MTRRKPRRPNHMTPPERDECVRLFLAGTTKDALAERYDRDVRTIQRLLSRKSARRRDSNVDNIQTEYMLTPH